MKYDDIFEHLKDGKIVTRHDWKGEYVKAFYFNFGPNPGDIVIGDNPGSDFVVFLKLIEKHHVNKHLGAKLIQWIPNEDDIIGTDYILFE